MHSVQCAYHASNVIESNRQHRLRALLHNSFIASHCEQQVCVCVCCVRFCMDFSISFYLCHLLPFIHSFLLFYKCERHRSLARSRSRTRPQCDCQSKFCCFSILFHRYRHKKKDRTESMGVCECKIQ